MQSNAILEYRWGTVSGGISSTESPFVSTVLRAGGNHAFPDGTPITATNAYDLGEDALNMFVVGTYNGVQGVHQFFWVGAGSIWLYVGAVVPQAGITWISSAIYLIGQFYDCLYVRELSSQVHLGIAGLSQTIGLVYQDSSHDIWLIETRSGSSSWLAPTKLTTVASNPGANVQFQYTVTGSK